MRAKSIDLVIDTRETYQSIEMTSRLDLRSFQTNLIILDIYGWVILFRTYIMENIYIHKGGGSR